MIRDNIFPTDYVIWQTALKYKHFRLQPTLCLTDGVKNQKVSTHTYFLPQKPVSGLKETAAFQITALIVRRPQSIVTFVLKTIYSM